MLARVFETKRRGRTLARTKQRSLLARRQRHPVLAAFGDADQAVLRFLRTRGHQEPIETVMKALGVSGELAAIWVGDRRRRGVDRRAPARPVGQRRGHGAGRDRGQLRRQAGDRPRAAADRGAPAARQGADQALLSLDARDLVGRRSDRASAGSSPARARTCSASPRRSASAVRTSGCTTRPTCSAARRSASVSAC